MQSPFGKECGVVAVALYSSALPEPPASFGIDIRLVVGYIVHLAIHLPHIADIITLAHLAALWLGW